jgi:hypothetical protein
MLRSRGRPSPIHALSSPSLATVGTQGPSDRDGGPRTPAF